MDANKFLDTFKKRFTKIQNVETGAVLTQFMKHKGDGNIKKYILGMLQLNEKLKTLKIEFSEDYMIHLAFSLPQFSKFE